MTLYYHHHLYLCFKGRTKQISGHFRLANFDKKNYFPTSECFLCLSFVRTENECCFQRLIWEIFTYKLKVI